MPDPSRASASPSPLLGIAAGALFLALSSLVISCGDDQLQAADGACTYTYECPAGDVCQSGRCVPASGTLPVGEAGADGGDDEPGQGGSGGAGGAGGDEGEGGTGGSEEEPSTRVTFAPDDYRRCYDSLECAVFGGDCLVELPLSRPAADGTDRIAIWELDRTFKKGQGICGVPCTNEPKICESHTITSPDGQSKPSSCQLIFVGESPYPGGPLPFQIDELAMARGVPYASICRPPFEHAEAHSPSFCEPCTEAAHCEDGDGCWLDRPFATTPSGACVQRCELQKDCPFGFRCTDIDDRDPFLVGEEGSYCIPIAGTCGRCLDRDGDQRGVGTCGPLDEPFTEVDCDDSNPDAYFDPLRPTHPFPTFCGDFDFNCNGISDRVEQAGSEAHCSFCGDRCGGAVANGVRRCSQTEAGFACTAICEPGFADCNGDPSDGCETELRPGMIWYRDRDGDGRGNRNEFAYFCDGDAPAGWVRNPFDCDDQDPNRYGGGVDESGATISAALEVCDGIDNDCNGLVDDGVVVSLGASGAVEAVAGEQCDTGLLGVCAAGHYVCEAADDPGVGEPLAAMRCAPDRDPGAAMRSAEICNGLDDNCNGQIDEGVDWYEEQGQSNPNGPGAPAICEVPGGVGVCAFGVRQCTAGEDGEVSWACVQNEPSETDHIGDGIDSNCDGIDGDLHTGIFVRPVAGGGSLNGNDANDGSAQAPVATLATAVQRACAGVPSGKSCRDIYVETGIYTSNAQLNLPTSSSPGELPYVRIYGGFQGTVACEGEACELRWERPEGLSSTLVREAPAPNPSQRHDGDLVPFGTKYAAIGAAQGSGPMELLLDRMEVFVEGPDPGYQLEGNAPTQIGVECPQRGCGRLEFSDVAIEIDDALQGGAGAHGELGAFPETTNDGVNGCKSGETCAAGSSISYNWSGYASSHWFMNYGICNDGLMPIQARQDFQRSSAQCADGRRPTGGNSGGFRCYKGNNSYIYYSINGSSGGGLGGGGGGSGSSRGKRGTNGNLGRGASYVRLSAAPELGWSTGGPTRPFRYQLATSGQSGGGGGGAGGCLQAPKYLNHPYGCNANHRGGGGGAGGCNGTFGQRGGDGGSVIGLVLVSPSSGELDLQFTGPFAVKTGRAGKGGAGGKGGGGQGGGWGGLGKTNSESINFAGGEGGDGGGGGGGGGGIGGSAVGIWQVCTRPDGTEGDCRINLPPKLVASPDLFISVGAAGAKGAGGEGGKRGEKTPHMYQRVDGGASPASAGSGQDGIDGNRIYLHFSRGN